MSSGYVGIAASGPRSAWALGFTRGTYYVMRWNGKTWHKMLLPKHFQGTSISGSSASDLWVSGNQTTPDGAIGSLKRLREVRYVGVSTGRYDIIVEAFFFDQQHFLDFISNRLGRMQGITGLETSIILDIVKFSYEWEIA